MPFIGRDGTTAFLPATVNTSSSLTISNEGDLVVDTSTLFVDSSANKVGIGTQTPALRAHIYSTENADAALIESTQNFATLRFKSATNTSGPTVGIDGAGGLQLDQKDTSKYIAFAIGSERLRILNSGKVRVPDNGMFVAGADNDLQIYHDGTRSRIHDDATNATFFTTNALHIRNKADTEAIAKFGAGAAVELYHNNSQKFVTTTTGIDVIGEVQCDSLDVDGAINIDGSKVTYDSANGLKLADSIQLRLGAGNDLRIYHDGVNSSIQNTTGYLYLYGGTNNIYIRGKNDEDGIVVKPSDSIELYHNGQKRFETLANGAKVTGTLDITSDLKVAGASNILVGGTAITSASGIVGGSLDGTLGAVTMAYLPAAPSSPVQGQFYFNSLSSKAQIYTGSSFVDLVPSGGGGGGGGGGGSSTDAQATFRKYTYSLSSTTNSVSGAADGVTSAGNFVIGRKYQIKTVGNTVFTDIGAANNNVGTIFTATGAGSGNGDAYDVLVYVTDGSQNVEVYVNGVKAVEGATNDYVATSGTSVNFVANLVSGDVVDILVYELLTNDAFVLASGGTFTGNVGINTTSISNRLHINSNASQQGILLTQDGNNYSSVISDANRTSADNNLLQVLGKWNGKSVAEITFRSGNDTTNKDDGQIVFSTSSANNLSTSERLRITSNGSVNIGGNYTQTTHRAQITTGTNKHISFGSAAHNDFSNEASGIFFSRISDGSKTLSGIFQHSDTSLGIATRGDLTLHAGGTSTYSASPEVVRVHSSGKTTLKGDTAQLELRRKDGVGSPWFLYAWSSGLNIYPSANAADVYIGRDGYTANLDLYNGGLTVAGTSVLNSSRQLSNVTYGGNTIWHAGNDGSGSGLDADTVDGIQASNLVRSDTSDSLTGASYTFTSTSTNVRLDFTGHAGASNYNYFIRAKNDGGNRAVHFVNGTTRSADGGPNVYTIRNDGGALRLGHSAYITKLVGDLTNDGNNYITFGPNSTWGARLRVGGDGYQGASGIANIAATNGNLHLDAASGNSSTYINYYAGTGGVRIGNGASGTVAIFGTDGDLWKGSSDNTGSKYWHSGNDGSGSGLDADTLDGQHLSSTTQASDSRNSVMSSDTRSTNSDPNDRARGLYVDFKTNSTTGLSDGGSYHGLLTFRAYGSGNDLSGGYPHQLGFTANNNIYLRKGTGTTTWGSWKKLWHEGNITPLQDYYEANINSPDAESGTWTEANSSSSWGDPKFNNVHDMYRYADGNGAMVEYDVPAGYKSAWISQLQWNTGGYADCYGVQADGNLIFLRRICTRQTVENSNHGNPDQHDGSTITHVGSGLDHFTSLRIVNRAGRIHITGLAWTKNDNPGYEGTGMVHWEQLEFTPALSGTNTLGGSLAVSGSISKQSGTFTIPHPLESKKETHNLSHSFIEGPQCDLIYRGKVNLVDGAASVNIDTKSGMTEGTFIALCRDVQCFTTNETGWTAIKGSVTGNILNIIAQENTCTDTISWMVVGERQDEAIKQSNITDNEGNLIVEPNIVIQENAPEYNEPTYS